MIKFENVSVTYPGGVEALKDLDLEIKEGDFIMIKKRKWDKSENEK